jgi:chromosome segregation ATPase
MAEQATQAVTQPIAHQATQLERTKLHMQTQISEFEKEVSVYEKKIEAIQGQIAALQTALDSLDNPAQKRKPGRPRTRPRIVRDKHKMSEEGRLNITVRQKKRHLEDNLGKLKDITDPNKRKRLEKRIAKQQKEYEEAKARQERYEAEAKQAQAMHAGAKQAGDGVIWVNPEDPKSMAEATRKLKRLREQQERKRPLQVEFEDEASEPASLSHIVGSAGKKGKHHARQMEHWK